MILWTFSHRAEQDEKKPVLHKGKQVWVKVKSISNEALRGLSAYPSGLETVDREKVRPRRAGGFSAVGLWPGGDGNLSQAVEQHSRRQADEGHHGAFQEFQLPNQDVRRLSAGRDLLHEVQVNLWHRSKPKWPKRFMLCCYANRR